MRLASLNLNKRMGTTIARRRLTYWLDERKIDVLVAQEPWKSESNAISEIVDYQYIGGDGRLSAWIHQRWAPGAEDRPEAFLQRIELGWLTVFNTYLDAYSGTTRVSQLKRLRELALAENGRPVLLAGDFNLAPSLADGRYGGRPSTFNNESERASLRELLASVSLIDATEAEAPQFTFARIVNGQLSQFRCDLALLSDHLRAMAAIAYDHETRTGDGRFTDHSAVLADLPVTLTAQARPTLFEVEDDIADRNSTAGPGPTVQPYKTAMNRSGHSPTARTVTSVLVPLLRISSVLDHGCGRGADVAYYRSCAMDADGWDPYPGFGFLSLPSRMYDLVTSVFVLNVLPNPWQRIQALQHAAACIRPGGHMLVVTRSPADIELRAKAGRWKNYNDGYWSSEARGTFQRGISTQESIELASQAGMCGAKEQDLLPAHASACLALLTKPARTGGSSSQTT